MRKNLKIARQNKGLSQRELAMFLGIHVRAYKYLESGHTKGKIETWDKLEDLFGVNQRILRENRKEGEKNENC